MKSKNDINSIIKDLKKEASKRTESELSISVDEDEFRRLKNRLEAYQYIPIKYGKEAFDNVSTYMRGNKGPIRRYFNQEKGPRGKWPLLKPSTLRDRARGPKRFPPGPILWRTGSLYRFATAKKASNTFIVGDEARFILGYTSGTSKNMNKYFTHMLGSNKGWGGAEKPIPARPFVPSDPKHLTKDEQEKITDIMRNTINSLARKKARRSM